MNLRRCVLKTLRPYQEAAIASLFDWFAYGQEGHPLVVAPVGAGKSLLISEFIKRISQKNRVKVVIVTHVKELLEQTYDELIEQFPECDTGFYCAGLGQKELWHDVTFATIQSICGKARDFNKAPQIIICDEAHLIPHNSDTQYRRFFNDCLELNHNCKIIGFTGTPFRADSGRLDEGDNRLFDGIAYQIDMAYMVQEGYWSKPVTPTTEARLSVEGVKIVKGDYAQGQLEAAVDVDEKTEACVSEIVYYGASREKWLVFTAGVMHCEHVRDSLRRRGISAEMVTGETPKDEREAILERYKAGEIKALVNVAVLTTGFNVPSIDMVVFMRPTRSPVLYIQCAGRGVRPVYESGFDLSTKDGRLAAIEAGKKKDCLFLDFGNIISTLGPIDQVEIRKKQNREKTEKAEAPTKICPSCGAVCYASQKVCFSCSYAFPVAEIDDSAAKNANMMSSEPVTMSVYSASYHVHTKRGDDGTSPQTMRATYITEDGPVSEYVCFDHTGFALSKATAWKNERLPSWPMPSVSDAVSYPWPTPDEITVKKEGKFLRVVSAKFPELMVEPEAHKRFFPNAEELDIRSMLDDDIPF